MAEDLPILLVEDTVEDRTLLQLVVQKEGLPVRWLEAASIKEATLMIADIASGRQARPALGIIDLRLPDGYGPELIVPIRTQCGHWPLVLHSTSDAPADQAHADPDQDVFYLSKPYELAGFAPLLGHIRHSLAQHGRT